MTDWVVGGHEGRFSRDPLPVFSAGGHFEQFRHGQGCPLFDVVHPPFPLPITASPTLQSVLKDDFGGAVVACDMSESCQFPSLDRCQCGSAEKLRSLLLRTTAIKDCLFLVWRRSGYKAIRLRSYIKITELYQTAELYRTRAISGYRAIIRLQSFIRLGLYQAIEL